MLEVKIPRILRIFPSVPSVEAGIHIDRLVYISFSERVVNFTTDLIDVTVDGCLKNFRGNGKDFLVEVAEVDTDVYLSVEAHVVRGVYGKWNLGSNVLLIERGG